MSIEADMPTCPACGSLAGVCPHGQLTCLLDGGHLGSAEGWENILPSGGCGFEDMSGILIPDEKPENVSFDANEETSMALPECPGMGE